MNSQNRKRCAFFDVDETVLNFKSMFSFLDFYILKSKTITKNERIRTKEAFYADFNNFRKKCNDDRKKLNRKYYQFFKDRKKAEISMIAQRWFFSAKRNSANVYIQPVLERLRKIQKDGIEIVFVSGSCHEILTPIMKDIGIGECIATILEVDGQRYTGSILGKQIIAEGKYESIKDYAAAKNINLSDCFAFGDHISDLSMLSAVGTPVVIEGDSRLEQIAINQSWEIINKSLMR